MTARQLIAVIIRLFAILLVFQGIWQLSSIFGYSVTGIQFSPLNIGLTIVLPFFIGIGLWFFPVFFSTILVRHDLDGELSIPLNPANILLALILAIGLLTLYWAVMDAIYWTFAWSIVDSESSYLFVDPYNKASVYATIVELTASIALLVWAKSISKFMLSVTK